MTTDQTAEQAEAVLENAKQGVDRLRAVLSSAYIGQEQLVEQVLTGLFAGGHLLLEGSPGLGKTFLVRLLAKGLSLDFSRIQFTPDLMPGDITGGLCLLTAESGQTTLEFQPGPIFANLVLADEINRGTPKTQSALLEAMQEQAVTLGNERRNLDSPFAVIATQNPIEMEGTYPLPEAQLDRFLFKLDVPFPSLEELKRIGRETTARTSPDIEPVMGTAELIEIQRVVRELVVSDPVADLAARLTMQTHPEHSDVALVQQYVRFGASPRATQALLMAGRARALMAGRPWVSEEDIVALASPVLRHRVFLSFDATLARVTSDKLVAAIVEHVGA